ncbi:hypothetical protein PSPO01_07098 [Paraphaeosphaeria sporulosa]
MISTPQCLWISFLRDRWHQIVLHRRSGGMLVDLIADALGHSGVRTSWSTHSILCNFSTMNRILLHDNVPGSMFRDAHRGGDSSISPHSQGPWPSYWVDTGTDILGRANNFTTASIQCPYHFPCSHVQLVHETELLRYELKIGRRVG